MGLFTESNFILKSKWRRGYDYAELLMERLGVYDRNRQDSAPKDRSSDQTLLCPDQNEVQGGVVAFCYIREGRLA